MIRLRSVRGMLTGAALAMAACALPPSSRDPFGTAGAGSRPRSDARPVRVRLEVVCDRCAVSYSIAGRTTTAAPDDPIWRATFDRYPRFPEAIRLTASGRVERIRIYVDGDPVAEEERPFGDGDVVLQAETVIPLLPDPAMPDTANAEGNPAGRAP